MAFGFKIEPGEHLVLAEVCSPSRTVESFALGVSDRAVYIAVKRRFRLRHPWLVQRILLGEITRVTRKVARPYFWWLLSGVLVAVGLLAVSTFIGLHWSYPLAVLPTHLGILIVVGAAVPFLVHPRTKLTVFTADKRYKWRPSATMSQRQRERVDEIQLSFLAACIQAGLSVDKGPN